MTHYSRIITALRQETARPYILNLPDRYGLPGQDRKCDQLCTNRLAGYAYNYENKSHLAQSKKLHGDVEWTRLEVKLNSGDMAYIMPYLVLEGNGTAWFDNVCFTECKI